MAVRYVILSIVSPDRAGYSDVTLFRLTDSMNELWSFMVKLVVCIKRTIRCITSK